MYEYGQGVAQNYEEACKWYRLATEQGGADAPRQLGFLKKNHPVAAYHLAMMETDVAQIENLITKTPSLMDALLWDFNRSKENEKLIIMLFAQSSIFKQSELIKKLGSDATELLIKCLSSQIVNKTFDMNSVSWLKNLRVSSMNQEECESFAFLISDIWYYTKAYATVAEHNKFTRQATEFLRQTFHHLESIDSGIKDTSLLRQCALIFIKNAYGSKFEVTFNQTPSFQQLMVFFTVHKLKPEMAYQEMNAFLNIELIKPAQFTKHAKLLNQLMAYLEIKEVTEKAPTLAALKNKLLEDWKTIKEPSKQIATQILSGICQKAEMALKHSDKNPKTFFSIKANHAKELFSLLAENRFHEVLEALNANLKALSENKITQNSLTNK